MGSIGASEILVILIVALLVLGPERLPEAARQVGRVLGEIRRIGGGLQADLRDAMDAPGHAFEDSGDDADAYLSPQATAATTPRPPSPGVVVAPPPARPDSDVVAADGDGTTSTTA